MRPRPQGLTVIADKVLTGDLNIPRESSMVTLRDIIRSGKLKLDPSRNDFPVTLHDPCNLVRLMGIVTPQREIIDAVVPKERFAKWRRTGSKTTAAAAARVSPSCPATTSPTGATT